MTRKPEDIKPYQPISAPWLNAVKNSSPGKIRGDGKYIAVTEGANGDMTIRFLGNIPGVDPIIQFWAEIRNYTAVSGDVNQWTYGFRKIVVKWNEQDGYYLDTPSENGTAGTSNDPSTCAINLNELQNDNTGIEGNGVNVDNLNEGLSIQPIAVGAVVRMYRIPISGATEEQRQYVWAFTEPNGIDGTCV